MTIQIPPVGHYSNLRRVRIAAQLIGNYPDHALYVWEAVNRGFGRPTLGYAFWPGAPEGEPLFLGENYFPAPHIPIDSDACLLACLSFLTHDYCETDNEAQAEWRRSSLAETLNCGVLMAEESERESGHSMELFRELES